MSRTSSAPAEIRDAIARSLLALSLPGRHAVSESNVQRSAIFHRDWAEPLTSVTQVRVRSRFQIFSRKISNTVEILTVAGPLKWKTVFVGTETDATRIASKLITAIKTHLASSFEFEAGLVALMYSSSAALFQNGAYIRVSQLAAWQSSVRDQRHHLNTMATLLQNPFAESLTPFHRWKELAANTGDLLSSDCQRRRAHNRSFIERNRTDFDQFFRTVEKKPLTDEQIEAALIFDDTNLTVASAGSGKTSVIVAKVGFALASGMFKDEEILALAFNVAAVEDLQRRMNDRLTKALGRPVNIAAKTFHALGKSALPAHDSGRHLRVVQLSSAEGTRLFLSCYDRLAETDPSFRNSVLEWIIAMRYPEPKLEPGTDNVEANEKRYEAACKLAAKAKRDSSRKAYDPWIPTLDSNVTVRSREEAAIANWLFLRHIPFEYERPTWGALSQMMGIGLSASGKQKPYKPDFLYRSGSVKRYIYHEHFGIDDDGHAPPFLGPSYEKSVAKKRLVFRQLLEGRTDEVTDCLGFFETRSSQFKDGSLFAALEAALRKHSIAIPPEDEALKAAVLADFRKSSDVQNIFLKFVQKFKESGLTKEELRERSHEVSDQRRANVFLGIVFKLHAEIEREYRAIGLIEYSDMLRQGAERLAASIGSTPYKLILVDEFQDAAKMRIDLVEQLAAQHPGQVILFLVGDDWQAINRYAGSDIEIFRRFSQKIEVEQRPLSRTFRCAQGIADVARLMVLQGGRQADKPKAIIAESPVTKATVRIVGHGDDAQSRAATLTAELDRIAALGRVGARRPKVFVLTRTKKDTTVPEGLELETFGDLINTYADTLDIERSTIHSSKGLEADYVIIGGLETGSRGFPSDMSDDPLFELLLPPMSDAMEEERRLFNVALTRARKQAVLLTATDRVSEFIVELSGLSGLTDHLEWIGLNPAEWRICPRCRKGIVERHDSVLECRRWPRCAYREKVEVAGGVQ
jgi:DNA helicase-4